MVFSSPLLAIFLISTNLLFFVAFSLSTPLSLSLSHSLSFSIPYFFPSALRFCHLPSLFLTAILLVFPDLRALMSIKWLFCYFSLNNSLKMEFRCCFLVLYANQELITDGVFIFCANIQFPQTNYGSEGIFTLKIGLHGNRNYPCLPHNIETTSPLLRLEKFTFLML